MPASPPAEIAEGGCCPVSSSQGSAVGLAATRHFLASLPECPPCLIPIPPMLEFEQTFNPFRDQLCSTPFRHERLVQVLTGPELGIEIDRAVLQRYRVA